MIYFLANKCGHNLLNLWNRANQNGFALGHIETTWLEQLDSLHSAPFNLRYPIGFHGMVYPNQQEMFEGTKALVQLAETTVR